MSYYVTLRDNSDRNGLTIHNNTNMTKQQTNDLILPAPVLIVEDDALMQKRLHGLMNQLGYKDDALVFAGRFTEAATFMADQPFAIALVDLGLPDGNGIDLITMLRSQDPGMSILVISAWSTEESILQALKAGANGYVLKERDDMEVILSIRSTLRGGAPIDPFVARHILSLLDTSTVGNGTADTSHKQASGESGGPEMVLSVREKEILNLVAGGLSNREIAEQLFISRYTVECHVKNIYRKLSVSSRTKAVNEARMRGLLL